MSPVIRRIIGKPLATVITLFFAAALLAVAHPAPAHASAIGCTAAPGRGAGSQNCIEVAGSKLTVNSAVSTYVAGLHYSHICDAVHQFRYKKKGASKYKTKTFKSSNGCGLAVSARKWNAPGKMKNGSNFCARSKNNHTNHKWTPYACVKIKKS